MPLSETSNYTEDIELISPNFCEARSQIHVSVVLWLWFREFLGSPAEVEENWDVRRGSGCWRWQIAEASRASSIPPCGYTMWLPPPQETWSTFHLYKTGVFGGIDILQYIALLLKSKKKGAHMFSVLVFSTYWETKIHATHRPSTEEEKYKNTWSTRV